MHSTLSFVACFRGRTVWSRSLQQDEMLDLKPGDRILLGTARRAQRKMTVSFVKSHPQNKTWLHGIYIYIINKTVKLLYHPQLFYLNNLVMFCYHDRVLFSIVCFGGDGIRKLHMFQLAERTTNQFSIFVLIFSLVIYGCMQRWHLEHHLFRRGQVIQSKRHAKNGCFWHRGTGRCFVNQADLPKKMMIRGTSLNKSCLGIYDIIWPY